MAEGGKEESQGEPSTPWYKIGTSVRVKRLSTEGGILSWVTIIESEGFMGIIRDEGPIRVPVLIVWGKSQSRVYRVLSLYCSVGQLVLYLTAIM